jgi:chromosome segregation ATPase
MIRTSTLIALAGLMVVGAGCGSTEKKDLKRDADRAKIEAIRAEKDRDGLKAEIESLKKAGQTADERYIASQRQIVSMQERQRQLESELAEAIRGKNASDKALADLQKALTDTQKALADSQAALKAATAAPKPPPGLENANK